MKWQFRYLSEQWGVFIRKDRDDVFQGFLLGCQFLDLRDMVKVAIKEILNWLTFADKFTLWFVFTVYLWLGRCLRFLSQTTTSRPQVWVLPVEVIGQNAFFFFLTNGNENLFYSHNASWFCFFFSENIFRPYRKIRMLFTSLKIKLF